MSVIASAGPSLLTAAATLAGGWLVTTRVADRWDQTKKNRDMDQAAAHDFQRLYGEAIAIWKTWNALRGDYTAKFDPPEKAKWDCLVRATAAEGEIEALLARLAAERTLTSSDIAVLGALRQAFKGIRRAIREDKPIDWPSSDTPEYLAFKALASTASVMLAGRARANKRPGSWQAVKSFSAITDNDHERTWVKTGQQASRR